MLELLGYIAIFLILASAPFALAYAVIQLTRNDPATRPRTGIETPSASGDERAPAPVITPQRHHRMAGNLGLFLGGLSFAVVFSYLRNFDGPLAEIWLPSAAWRWLASGHGLQQLVQQGLGALYLPLILAAVTHYRHADMRRTARWFFWSALFVSFIIAPLSPS